MRARVSWPAGLPARLPVVAIVGRPNVGKSTLFNRLAGQRLALVDDVAGVTRDRHYAEAEALGRPFALIDTAGFDPEGEAELAVSLRRQVELALQEADVVICVFDATTEPVEADRAVVEMLRRTAKPVLYCATKADSRDRAASGLTHYQLGMDHIYAVSGLHGHGLGTFEEALSERLPKTDEAERNPRGDDVLRVAIVGRPNAGKSSLVNRLVGEDRQLVDDQPGTTVDSIHTWVDSRSGPFVLVDTAGMRRNRAARTRLEGLATLRAIRSLEQSHVAVLLIDASERAVEQDARIAGLAVERGCGLVVALNKMDLLSKQAGQAAQRHTKELLSFAPWAPILKVSARTGHSVQTLVQRVHRVRAEHQRRVSTGQLNRFFEEVLERHPPPTMHRKPVRLYYITQAQSAPPTFVIRANNPKLVHFSYQRYVANQLRERFGFEGTPLRVFYRRSK